MGCPRFTTAICVLAISSLPLISERVRGDIVQYSDNPSSYSQVTTILSIAGVSAGSETAATSFIVPGSGSVSLTFTIEKEGGVYDYDFGFFDASAVTAYDPVTQTEAWATAALANATHIFSDPVDNTGATETVSVLGGSELIFYLIPDNTLASFNANPGNFYPSSTVNQEYRAPLFSYTDANPGQYDQMMSWLDSSAGVTLFTFEDQTRDSGSDENFADLAFSIDTVLSGTQSPTPEPASILLLTGIGLILVLRRGRRTASV